MHTSTTTSHRDQLGRLVHDARTPQEHALLHYSFAPVGAYRQSTHGDHDTYAACVLAGYRQLSAQNAFADFNAAPATPTHAVYLSKIQQTDGGLDAHRINGNYRALFLRRGWITAKTHTGADAGPRDWAATVRLTDLGGIQLASTMSRPIDLDNGQGIMLARIERFGDAGYVGQRFGAPQDWAVIELFDLVDVAGLDRGYQYRVTLTTAGREALARWRNRPRRLRVPTAAQYELLQELIAGHTAARNALYNLGTYEVCESEEWVTWGTPVSQGAPAPLFVTAAGRDAVTRYTAQMLTAQGHPVKPTVRNLRTGPAKLTAGQSVRLANRRGYRTLSADWVIVDHVQRVPSQGRTPGGYIVWVYNADRTAILKYAGGTLFTATTRFEIKGDR